MSGKNAKAAPEKPLSLAPVKFEDAVKAALETKPEKKSGKKGGKR